MLLTDAEMKRIENKLKTDTDSDHKKGIIAKYAVYKACFMEIEKVIQDLKEYGKR
jgi:hypothetical protein